MKQILFLLPLFLLSLFFSCKDPDIVNPTPGKRYVVPGKNFSITGEKCSSTKIVGIEHAPTRPEVSPDFINDYDDFWKEFLKNSTKKDSASKMIIAAEIYPELFGPVATLNKIVVGRVIEVKQPQFFIDQYLFSAGVRRLCIADPRPHNLEFEQIMIHADSLFSATGGLINTQKDTTDELGLPVAFMAQKPKLSQADKDFLKNLWYPKVYMQHKAFEKKVYDVVNKGGIGVIGAAHAIQIAKDYKIPIAIVASEQQIHFAIMAQAIHKFYIEEIGEK